MNIFDKIKLADIGYKLYERRQFMISNYKTTIAGIVGALAIWLPELQKALATGHADWGQLILGLAVLVFGAVSKDFDISGTGTAANPHTNA
jgi:hypothetical protein